MTYKSTLHEQTASSVLALLTVLQRKDWRVVGLTATNTTKNFLPTHYARHRHRRRDNSILMQISLSLSRTMQVNTHTHTHTLVTPIMLIAMPVMDDGNDL